MNTTSNISLSLVLELVSLASLIHIPNIDEETIQKASIKLLSSQFLEKLWDIQSTVEIPIDKISKHSQTVQWNGDENVDIDNCSIFLPK